MTDPSLLILRGAWRGQAGDPDRRFHGTVTSSTHPDVPAGQPCHVTFEHSGRRVTDAGDHGTYRLHVAGRDVTVTRFVCHAASGASPRDETVVDDWHAELA